MESTVHLIDVNNKQLKRRFINLPRKFYKADSAWIPPLNFELNRLLNTKKNPFFRYGEARYWIAVKNGIDIGRISAIVNSLHNEYYNERSGFFGYFECVDDVEVSRALFDTAGKWLLEKGCVVITGPVNLNTNNECGLLVEGFEKNPVMQMPYNHPYYIRLILENNFKKEADLLAYNVDVQTISSDKKLLERYARISAQVTGKENLKFRKFDSGDFKNEVERIRVLFNDYMSENWGFVPIPADEFKFISDSLKQILVTDLAFFAEVSGVPVGFAIALPDINQVIKMMNGKLFPFGIFKYLWYKNKINSLRLVLLGVSKPYRKRGLEAVFYYRLIEAAKKHKYKQAELSWVSENNRMMIKALEGMPVSLYKRYRIYKKELR